MLIKLDWVTVPVELSVTLVLAVKPTVLTVPIAKPLFSTKETVPVLPAKVVIALLVLVSVYVPPLPRSSRPAAVIAADWVTVPVELNVRVVAVTPLVEPTVPIAKPLFSKKEIVPVLPAKVVIALEVSVKV